MTLARPSRTPSVRRPRQCAAWRAALARRPWPRRGCRPSKGWHVGDGADCVFCQTQQCARYAPGEWSAMGKARHDESLAAGRSTGLGASLRRSRLLWRDGLPQGYWQGMKQVLDLGP